MIWKKLGLVFKPSGQNWWMSSHAATPVPLKIDADKYRFYFGTRDKNNHPRIGYVEVDINNPCEVLDVSSEIVLDKGSIGYFDDNGVYPGPIIHKENKLIMYYMGRSNGESPIYRMCIGVAESNDGGRTFARRSSVPLLDRSEHDPWMVSTPFILEERGLHRLWYLSGLGWEFRDGEYKSFYHIKYAESLDGDVWNRNGSIAIDLASNETNICGPTVIKYHDEYHMWYCYVAGKNAYRIGYALSEDGLEWSRRDNQSGISVSDEGWDSECQAYPYVFRHEDKIYMLYSGNEFGKGGFGIALLDD